MPADKASKKFVAAKRKSAARICACLILCCVFFHAFPLFGRAAAKSSSEDLVYCPLQKKWVEKYVPPPPVKKPLAEVCAPTELKSRFFFEALQKPLILGIVAESQGAEKFFFAYAEKGSRAFAEIASFPNLPEREDFAKFAAERKGTAANYRTDYEPSRTENFTLIQIARPPTALKSVAPEARRFRPLEQISRRIKPRAPPVFFS